MVAACCVLQCFQLGDVESLCRSQIPSWHLGTLGLPGPPEEGLFFCESCAWGSTQCHSLVTSLEDSRLLHELLGFEPDLCPLFPVDRIPKEQLELMLCDLAGG